MFEIRQARSDELDEMLTVMTTAFGVPRESWEAGFFTFPHDDLRNKQVVVLDGRIVSCLEFIPAQIYLGGSIVTMGGIAGVATLPNERKHGYAGKLMEYSVHALHELGYATSALYPFSYKWYRKYGWEFASHYFLYSVKPRDLPPYAESVRIRPYEDRDLPELMRIYEEHYSAHVGPFVRSEREWREHLFQRFKDVQVYEQDHVQGYLIAETSDQDDGKHYMLKEMLATTAASSRGLVGYLAQLSQEFTLIEFTTCEFDLHDLGLFTPRGDWEEGYESRCNVKLRPGFMFRIVDLMDAMKALVRRISYFPDDLTIYADDDTGDWNNKPIIIEGGHTPEVRNGEARLWLKADVRVLSQLYVGYISASEAFSLGKIEVSDPDTALRAADLLFKQYEPFIPQVNEF